MAPNGSRGLGLLRALAALLVRGPDAPYVLGDLDEGYARDLGRGVAPMRARIRYVRNAIGSAGSLVRRRARLPRVGASILDVKLGLRMLRKQPALTAAAVFALSIGIPVGLIPYQMVQMFDVTLPFDEGERIVGLRYLDLESGHQMPRTLTDFHVWNEELRSFQALGAARSTAFNVTDEEGRIAPALGSEISAATFGLLRVPPLLGRPLVASDEARGAPDVVVIGYDLWRSRMAGDPEVLGRTLLLAGVRHQIVGVMPEGFEFPIRDRLWVPLRADPLAWEPGEGPALMVYGRLAEGVSLEEADAELRTVGARLSAEFPRAYERLRAEVVAFPMLTLGRDISRSPEFFLLQSLAILLLALACGNVGTLILARTATRQREIAVRTALGAGRARILAQLFIEVLLLALLGAGVGLAIFDLAARRFQGMFDTELPFWLDFGVSPRTVGTALALAAFSATIAGVLPALKATGRSVQKNIQRTSAGASGIRFGGFSTALIVAEVAVSVALLTLGGLFAPLVFQDPDEGMGIAAEQYLAASIRIPSPEVAPEEAERTRAEHAERVRNAQEELVRRLSGEPGVGGVALASTLPGEDHADVWVEVEGKDRPADASGTWVRNARVDVDFFRSLRQPVLQGRDFDRADVGDISGGTSASVIVNTSFVEHVLQGRNPIGRRIRYVGQSREDPDRRYEIVGVVDHLGVNTIKPERDAGVYHPVARGRLDPVRIAVHVGADPAAFAPRLRRIVGEVDPTAMVDDPMPLDETFSEDRVIAEWTTLLLALLAATAIVLSAAGLYALLAFTVSSRTREIGVRSALGAQPRRIVGTVARRIFLQLALGVLLGAIGGWILIQANADDPDLRRADPFGLLVLTSVATLVVGMLACLPPLRRGLRIRPVEALEEG